MIFLISVGIQNKFKSKIENHLAAAVDFNSFFLATTTVYVFVEPFQYSLSSSVRSCDWKARSTISIQCWLWIFHKVRLFQKTKNASSFHSQARLKTIGKNDCMFALIPGKQIHLHFRCIKMVYLISSHFLLFENDRVLSYKCGHLYCVVARLNPSIRWFGIHSQKYVLTVFFSKMYKYTINKRTERNLRNFSVKVPDVSSV